jgi:hypothetical protein
MAALTMSMDQNACRYAAGVQTNGFRVEMLTEANIKQLFIGMFGKWITKVGGGTGPAHIYYFRDGVSEGQFAQVLEHEVAVMKRLLVDRFGAPAAGVSLWVHSWSPYVNDMCRSSGQSLSAQSATTSVSSPRKAMLLLLIATTMLCLALSLSKTSLIHSSMIST